MRLIKGKKQVLLRDLEKAMASSSTYEEWRAAAIEHDNIAGNTLWKRQDHSEQFDYLEIRSRLDNLRNIRKYGDHHELLFTLNEGIHGNMGGMGNNSLYQKALVGTKNLIHDYVDELVDSLYYLSEVEDDQIDFNTKLDFFHRASHCYGRSALMLSGGGSLGYFHIGVVKALLEENLLPTVISGSSIGAFLTGMIGTRTDEELREGISDGSITFTLEEDEQFVESMINNEMIDQELQSAIESRLANLIPDLTFQEAYELTGKAINISVSPSEPHQTSRLLNAITSPNVSVRSAVMASCAIPGVVPPVTLRAKNVHGESQYYLPTRQWLDGSFSEDLPGKRLSRLYGVNHQIVSMVNPLILPFVDNEDSAQSWTTPLKKLMLDSARTYAHSMQLLSQKYLSDNGKLSFAINSFNSILAQDYTGDINMQPSLKVLKIGKFIPPIPFKDMQMLIEEGEKATWKRIEQIRLATKISHALDEILIKMDSLHQAHAKEIYKTARKSVA